jgi:hypothetical protein
MEDFFRGAILEDPNIHTPGAATNAYSHQLKNAQCFFRQKLKLFDRTETLVNWYRLTMERLRFNLFEVTSDFDVCMTSEAINNRGKPLSDLEKLKSRVMYLAGLLAGTEGDDSTRLLSGYKDHINKCWKTVYDLLGWNSERILDDDQFLNLAWLLRYGKPGESRDRHLFQELFTPKRVVENRDWPSIRQFALDLATAAPPWVLVNNPEEAPRLVNEGHFRVPLGDESRLWLRRCTRLRVTSFEDNGSADPLPEWRSS